MADVDIEIAGSSSLGTQRVRGLINAALMAFAINGSADIGVHFVSVEEIQALNQHHRNVDTPTDVLSFPIDMLQNLPEEIPRQLGDLFICEKYVAGQVERRETINTGDATLADALERCVVHGMLHLLGEDHEVDQASADKMFALEQEILDAVRGAF